MSQETVAAQDMLTRFAEWQGREPESVAADTTYGNGEFVNADEAPMKAPQTAGDVKDALACTMAEVHARKMDPRTANALAYVATSLLRAIEVADLENRLIALEERREDSNGKP